MEPNKEGYQPTSEEVQEGEKMMSEEEKIQSEAREKEINNWTSQLVSEFDKHKIGEDIRMAEIPDIPTELQPTVFRRCFDIRSPRNPKIHRYDLALTSNLSKFESVDSKMAYDLLNQDMSIEDIMSNIKKFKELDHEAFLSDVINFYSDPRNTPIKAISKGTMMGFAVKPLRETLDSISDNLDQFDVTGGDSIIEKVKKISSIRTKGEGYIGHIAGDQVGHYARQGKGMILQDQGEQLNAVDEFIQKLEEVQEKINQRDKK